MRAVWGRTLKAFIYKGFRDWLLGSIPVDRTTKKEILFEVSFFVYVVDGRANYIIVCRFTRETSVKGDVFFIWWQSAFRRPAERAPLAEFRQISVDSTKQMSTRKSAHLFSRYLSSFVFPCGSINASSVLCRCNTNKIFKTLYIIAQTLKSAACSYLV